MSIDELADLLRGQGIKNGWSSGAQDWNSLPESRREKWRELARLVVRIYGMEPPK